MCEGKIIADVKNCGKTDGDAVIQVYVRAESPYAPAFPRLCGFTRISVPAGETVTAVITTDPLSDTVVDENGDRIPAGNLTFYVGMSQPDEKSVRMSGVKPVVLNA